jgi:prefoldin alpha subunit
LTAQDRQDQLRKLLSELQMMRGTADTLQERLQLLQGATTDLSIALASVTGLKDAEEGAPILVPTGASTFVNANLGDLSTIIVDIGAAVSVDMTLEEAEENMRGRLEELQNISASVQQQFQQVVSQMQMHQDVINRLGASIQGAPPVV